MTVAIVCAAILSETPIESPVSAVEAVTAAHAPQAGRLQLGNGSVVPGVLLPSRQTGLIQWQSPAFVSPLEFDLSAVAEISFPFPEVRPQPRGRHCVELAGNDVVFGELVSLDDEQMVLDIPGLGRQSLRSTQVVRWSRWERGDSLVYVGPSGLNAWRQEPLDRWRENGGQLWTDQDATYIQSNVGLPAQAIIEFTLSWKNRPNFSLAFGVDEDDSAQIHKRAYRMEVWDNERGGAVRTGRDGRRRFRRCAGRRVWTGSIRGVSRSDSGADAGLRRRRRPPAQN